MTVSATPKTRPTSEPKNSTQQATKAELAAQVDRETRRRGDRHAAIVDSIGIIQLPLAGLAAVEQRRIGRDEVGALTLDMVALEGHKGPLADVICDLADAYPVLGVVLDRVAKATPFGALLGVVMSLGVQIAENHRVLPAHLRGLSPTGVIARDDLVDELKTQAEKAQAAQAAERQNNGDRQPVNV